MVQKFTQAYTVSGWKGIYNVSQGSIEYTLETLPTENYVNEATLNTHVWESEVWFHTQDCFCNYARDNRHIIKFIDTLYNMEHAPCTTAMIIVLQVLMVDNLLSKFSLYSGNIRGLSTVS